MPVRSASCADPLKAVTTAPIESTAATVTANGAYACCGPIGSIRKLATSWAVSVSARTR